MNDFYECYPKGKKRKCILNSRNISSLNNHNVTKFSEKEVDIWKRLYNEIIGESNDNLKDSEIYFKIQKIVYPIYEMKEKQPPTISEIQQCIKIHVNKVEGKRGSEIKEMSEEISFNVDDIDSNPKFLINPFQTRANHSPFDAESINNFLNLWKKNNLTTIQLLSNKISFIDVENLEMLFSLKALKEYLGNCGETGVINFYNFKLPNPFMVYAFLSNNEYRKFRNSIDESNHAEAFNITKNKWVLDKTILPRNGIIVSVLVRKEDIDFKSTILLNTSLIAITSKDLFPDYKSDFLKNQIILKPNTKFRLLKSQNNKRNYYTDSLGSYDVYQDRIWETLRKRYKNKEDHATASVFMSHKNKVLNEIEGVLSDVQHKINESNFQALIHELKDVIIDFFVLSEEISHDIEEIINAIESPFSCSDCSHLAITYFDDIRGPELFMIIPGFPNDGELYADFKEILLSIFDVQINRNDCSLSVNLKIPGKTLENKHFEVNSPQNRGASMDLMISLIFKTRYNPYLIQNLLNQLKNDITQIPEVFKAFHKDRDKLIDLRNVLKSSLLSFKNSLSDFKESVFLSLKERDGSYCAQVFQRLISNNFD